MSQQSLSDFADRELAGKKSAKATTRTSSIDDFADRELGGQKPAATSMSIGDFADKELGRDKLRKDDELGQLVHSILGGVQGGVGAITGAMDKYADKISKLTGLSKGGAFKKISEYLNEVSASNREQGLGGLGGKIAAGFGQAVPDILAISALGPLGLPIHGAIMGGAEGGVGGALKGAATGAVMHGGLKFLGGTKLPVRIGGNAAIGAAMSPGGLEDRVAGAVTMGGLSLMGGGKKRLEKLAETKPIESEPGFEKPTVRVAPVPDADVIASPLGREPRTIKELSSEILRINEGRVAPEMATSLSALVEARAKARGISADDWVRERFGKMEIGGEPPEDALFKTLKVRGAAESDLASWYKDTFGDTEAKEHLQNTLQFLRDRAVRTPADEGGTRQQPISPNLKTLLSIDLSNVCRFRDMGSVCVYCYVEQPRTTGDPRAKSTLEPTAYDSSMIRNMPPELIRFFNEQGGIRMYSAADYQPKTDPMLDQIFADAASVGLKIKAITKHPDFVAKYGDKSNVSINISSDFKPETIAKMFGVDIETAKTLRGVISRGPTIEEALEWAGNRKNINIRYVAVNPEDTLQALRDPRISVVTGYHGRVKDTLLKIMEKQNPDVVAALGPEYMRRFTENFKNQKPKDIFKQLNAKDLELAKQKMCCQTGRCGSCEVCCGFKGTIKEGLTSLSKLIAGEPAASVEFEADGRAIIRAFSKSNVAGMAHELGHVFRRDLTSSELAAAEAWAGVKNRVWERGHEEKFANAFEIYLRRGIAPTPEMQGVFAKFKQWLTDIYSNLSSAFGKQRLDKNITELFDKMLGQDIAKAKAMERAGVVEPTAPPIANAEGAVRGGMILPGQDLPKRVGPINLENIDLSRDSKVEIANMEDALHQQRLAAKAEHRWDDVSERLKAKGAAMEIGDAFGKPYEEVIAEFKRRTGKTEGDALDLHVLAAREVLATAHRDFLESLRQYRANPTDEGLATLEILRARAMKIQADVGGGSSNVGRALNIHKKMVKAKDYLLNKQMDMVFKELGKDRLDQEAIDIIAALDSADTTAVMKFLAERKPATFRQKAFELWMNSVLSNPLTHAVNMSSNFASLLWRSAESLGGAGIDIARSKVTGKPRDLYAGEAVADVIGGFRGFKDGLKIAWERLKGNMDPNDVSKLEIPTRAIKGKKGEVARVPSKFLSAEDALYKTVIYSSKIHSEAYKRATLEGLRGDARRARFDELVKNPTDSMKAIAKHEAEYLTFNDKLNGIAADVARMRGKSRLPLEFIIPFVRTPYNIAKFGIQRTPLGAFDLYSKVKSGAITKGEAAKRGASIALTTAANVAIANMVANGVITGSGPTDAKERAQLYAQGWQPRSFKIGGKYYGYGRLEPLSTILGIYSDFWDIKGRATEMEANKIVGLTAQSLKNNLLDKTFMSGLMDLIKASDDAERYGADWVKRFAGSAVPAAVAGVARAIDPNLREARSVIDTIKSRIPGMTAQVPERLGPFGETSKRAGTTLSRLISPVPISNAVDDTVYKELGRLKMRISTPTLTQDGKPADRDAQRRLIMAAMPEVKAAALRLIQSEFYRNLPTDELKKKYLLKTMNKTRGIERKLFKMEELQ